MKYVKHLFTLLIVVLLSLSLVSCSSDDDIEEEPSLEVTPANLHGTWRLVTWNDGEPVPDGVYCYIVFNRREQTFDIYQSFDSMYGRHITGTFSVASDPYLGYVVSGTFELNMNGEVTTITAGDTYYTAPNVLHGVVALTDGVLLDVFTPQREDFLK